MSFPKLIYESLRRALNLLDFELFKDNNTTCFCFRNPVLLDSNQFEISGFQIKNGDIKWSHCRPGAPNNTPLFHTQMNLRLLESVSGTASPISDNTHQNQLSQSRTERKRRREAIHNGLFCETALCCVPAILSSISSSLSVGRHLVERSSLHPGRLPVAKRDARK